tara:strand:+ start:1725 stop:2411 length:687 start_codon:yes stop_codon:yes gene_type:complete
MVDEKTATRALTGNRQLQKSFQPLVMAWDPLTSTYGVDQTVSSTWKTAGLNGHYQETYFDTAGYTRDMLTLQPLTVFVQEAGRYQMTNPGGQRLLVVDLLTTERISDLNTFIGNLINNNDMVGFPNTTVDFTQVQYGRFREFLPTTQATTIQDVIAPTSDQQFGSLEATTNSKLWIYKILINIGLPSADVGTIIRYPSSRLVLQASISKEAELPFLMRQKRSYELSNY